MERVVDRPFPFFVNNLQRISPCTEPSVGFSDSPKWNHYPGGFLKTLRIDLYFFMRMNNLFELARYVTFLFNRRNCEKKCLERGKRNVDKRRRKSWSDEFVAILASLASLPKHTYTYMMAVCNIPFESTNSIFKFWLWLELQSTLKNRFACFVHCRKGYKLSF